MKKLMKILLCVAAGCVGMGCAALILGIVLGKSTGALSRDGASIWIEPAGYWENIYWNIRGVADGFKKGFDWDDLDEEDEDEKDVDYVQGEAAVTKDPAITVEDGQRVFKVGADKVQGLEIDLRHGYLEVEESEDDHIYVSWSEKKADCIQAACNSGNLLIQDMRQGRDARKDVEIYVSIPKKKRFGQMKLQLDAGELELDVPLHADLMKLTADAGIITAEELTSDNLDVSVGAGGIEISDGSFGKAKLNCGVGTIELEGSIQSDARAECGMGTIDLDLDKDLDAYNYVLNCGVGSIEIGDSSYSALSKEKRIDNGADATFMLKCGMGTIAMEGR